MKQEDFAQLVYELEDNSINIGYCSDLDSPEFESLYLKQKELRNKIIDTHEGNGKIMKNKDLILNLLNDITLSLNSLTDNFSDFSDIGKLQKTCSWNGYLIGEIAANINLLKILLQDE